MDNEDEVVYLEDVEKPQILYCKDADIQSLKIDTEEDKEIKIPALFDSKKHPVLLIYPLIDDEFTVTGVKAKVEFPLGKSKK